MKRIFTPVVPMIGLASLFAMGAVPNVQAESDEGCSNASLRGRYATWTDGTNVPEGTPVRSVGFATFDGEGNLSVTNTVNSNGTIIEQTFDAAYAVNDDCTGRIVDFADRHWVIAVMDEGKEVVFLRTDSNRVASGFYRKQSSNRHEKK